MMEWEWFGYAGHFIAAEWCQFRMCTKVGKYLISTVGDYHPNPIAGRQEVGCGRYFETYVFKAQKRCSEKGCDCKQPTINGREIDTESAQTAGEARANHIAMCRKYERKQEAKPCR